MKLREYNQLRLAEQASYLYKKGVYLMTRKDDHFHITLYSVDSFFVELWTDTQGTASSPLSVQGRRQHSVLH
jgi:hypothetical protein